MGAGQLGLRLDNDIKNPRLLTEAAGYSVRNSWLGPAEAIFVLLPG
jgi:hypothetical protein